MSRYVPYVVLLRFYSCFFFFKKKTAYEMRISDWSSDVCSSDLRDVDITAGKRTRRDRDRQRRVRTDAEQAGGPGFDGDRGLDRLFEEIGRASCRERVCQYV